MVKMMPKEVIPRPPVNLDDLEDWIEHSFRQPIPFLGGYPSMRDLSGTFRPAMDVYVGENEVVVKTELPGLKKDELEVNLKDNVLIITGEKEREEETSGDAYLRREISHGRFYRALRLPDHAEKHGLKAKFADGVLTVRIPKTEEAKREPIGIPIE